MATDIITTVNSTGQAHTEAQTETRVTDDHSFEDPAWLITINIVIGTCGFLGNSVVVSVFLARGKKTFKNWTQMYILHQSSIDCLASMVFLLLRYFNDSATLAAGGRREILICKIWFSEYFLWSLFMVSTYNLVNVSLERFLAIVFPVLHRNHMSRRKVLATMVIPWLWAFTFQSYWPPVYELFGTDCFPVWPQRWLQPFFGVLTFLFEYFLPLMVMLIAYGTIIYKLKGMSDKRENQASRMQADTRNSNLTADPTSYPAVSTISNMPTQEMPRTNGTLKPAKKEANIYSKAKQNVVKTLMTVFIVYVLSWTPTEVEFLLYNLGVIDIDFSGAVYRILSLVVLANMIANPLIYAGFYKDFQHSFSRVLSKCKKNRVDVDSQTVASNSQTLMIQGE